MLFSSRLLIQFGFWVLCQSWILWDIAQSAAYVVKEVSSDG